MKRFVFNFHHEENRASENGAAVVYFFQLVPKEDDPKFDYQYEDDWYEFLGNMEEYGVHDLATSDDELIGYHSDEVKPQDQPIVVQKWHDHFASLGLQPGEIQMLGYEEYHARFGMLIPAWDDKKNCLTYREPKIGTNI